MASLIRFQAYPSTAPARPITPTFSGYLPHPIRNIIQRYITPRMLAGVSATRQLTRAARSSPLPIDLTLSPAGLDHSASLYRFAGPPCGTAVSIIPRIPRGLSGPSRRRTIPFGHKRLLQVSRDSAAKNRSQRMTQRSTGTVERKYLVQRQVSHPHRRSTRRPTHLVAVQAIRKTDTQSKFVRIGSSRKKFLRFQAFSRLSRLHSCIM